VLAAPGRRGGQVSRSTRIWCMRALLGLELGFDLGERTQSLLLLFNPDSAKPLDQRIYARLVDGRSLVLGNDLFAQLSDLADPLTARR